jgi:hypothetical protein
VAAIIVIVVEAVAGVAVIIAAAVAVLAINQIYCFNAC